MNIQDILNGCTFETEGRRDRGQVAHYHGKPSPRILTKTKFPVDVVGLKPVQRKNVLVLSGEHESRFTIGFEVEKNSLHRNAVKEYPLFCGFERDGSCGYEAVTNILPLLPEGKWRMKVYEMFKQAEKIIDSRFSPADRRCGGHITITAKNEQGVNYHSSELAKMLRKNSGIIYALFAKRLSNPYCNGNLRMAPNGSDVAIVQGNGGRGGRYQFALERYFGGGVYGLEYRIVGRFESVKQMMRRYELFYELLDYSINRPNGGFEGFLSKIKPIVYAMYENDMVKAEDRIERARHYQRFINTGKISRLIAGDIDPQGRMRDMYDNF